MSSLGTPIVWPRLDRRPAAFGSPQYQACGCSWLIASRSSNVIAVPYHHQLWSGHQLSCKRRREREHKRKSFCHGAVSLFRSTTKTNVSYGTDAKVAVRKRATPGRPMDVLKFELITRGDVTPALSGRYVDDAGCPQLVYYQHRPRTAFRFPALAKPPASGRLCWL